MLKRVSISVRLVEGHEAPIDAKYQMQLSGVSFGFSSTPEFSETPDSCSRKYVNTSQELKRKTKKGWPTISNV